MVLCSFQSGSGYGTTVICRLQYWRRTISFVVLTTFISFLLSSVFASNDSLPSKFAEINKTSQKPKKLKRGRTKKQLSAKTPVLIRLKENNYGMGDRKYFSAETPNHKSELFSTKNKYQAYLEIGGAKYFNQQANIAGIYDLFMPLVQTDDELLFTDLRIFDRSGGSFEGNAHLGFRKLYLDKKLMFGAYVAFDRKRSEQRNWFNQITLGAEYWQNKWSIAGNIYKPIGRDRQFIRRESSVVVAGPTSRTIFTTELYEKSLPGGDAELGHSFTDNLTCYIGGYYFHTAGVDVVAGPKIRFTYNYNQPTGKILGVLDGIGIEAGLGHDKPRGNTAYIGFKVKVGLTNLDRNSNLFGFERHMIELVRRDPDVVVGNLKSINEQAIEEQLAADQITPEKQRVSQPESYEKDKNYFENLKKVKPFSAWSHEDLVAYKKLLTKELGLSEDILEEGLKKAWHRFSLVHHPDKCTGNYIKRETETFFAEKGGVFEILESVIQAMHGHSGINDNNKRNVPSADSSNPKEPGMRLSAKILADNIGAIVGKEPKKHEFNVMPVSSAMVPEAMINRAVVEEPASQNIETKNLSVRVSRSKFLPSFQQGLLETGLCGYNGSRLEYLCPSAGFSFPTRVTTDLNIPVVAAAEWVDSALDRFFNFLIPIKPVHAIELTKPLNDNSYVFGNITSFYSQAPVLSEEYAINIKSPLYFKELLSGVEFVGKLLQKSSAVDEVSSFYLVKYYDQLLKRISFLSTKTKTDKLPPDLVKAIFHAYSINHNYFKYLVIKILAEDNQLPVDVLLELLNTKDSLFVALRLAQNRINLPVEPTLRHFTRSLSDEDESLRIMGIDLFHQIRYQLPEQIRLELADALITLLPKVGIIQRSKINEILHEIVLDDDRKARCVIQGQIVNWIMTDDINEKKKISADLYEKINDKTAKELMPFFKQNLVLQNRAFLGITRAAFAKLEKYQKISWSEKEKTQLILFKVLDSDGWLLPLFMKKWINGVYSYEVGDSGELLLNRKQYDRLQVKLNKIGWDLVSCFKQIAFIDIKALHGFIDFVIANDLAKKELSQVLDKYNYNNNGLSISVRQLYSELLHNLVAQIKLSPPIAEQALKDHIRFLLKETSWPADFLFHLVKNGVSNNCIAIVTQAFKLLEDYKIKINPETIDRYGQVALPTLKKKSISEVLPAINLLLNDGSFFVERDIEAVCEEFIRLNPNNPEAMQLIDNFKRVFNKKNEIEQDWAQSRYKLERRNPGSKVEDGRIYLFTAVNEVCLVTKENKFCSDDGKSQELEKLLDAQFYEQAIKLNLVPKLRNISKPLSCWQGLDVLCEEECERKNKSRSRQKICRKTCANNDFIKWLRAIGKIDSNNIDDMAEAMAVLSQLIFNIDKFYPRIVQLLGLYSFATAGKGRIAEIATGEGKSVVIFMLAAIKVMEGVPAIDVLTSSNELAIRDSFQTKPLYDQLGISVSNNVQDASDCYKSTIVYGDAASFIAGILRDGGSGARNERGFYYLIVDEEDSMFCDSNNLLVLLASSIPGLDVANQLFVYMYGTVREMASVVEDRQFVNNKEMNGCYLRTTLFDKTQAENILKFFGSGEEDDSDKRNILKKTKLAETCGQFLKDYMRSYVEQLLNQPLQDRLVVIPRHLRKFIAGQIDIFITSLLSSFFYKEKVDYIIHDADESNSKNKKKDKYSSAVIVDRHNTGTLLYGLFWEDGLHQFLQVGSGLTMTPVSMVSVFMSYVSYFRRYDSISGLSGTIGAEAHQSFIKDIYGLESIIVPSFIPKDLIQLRTIFTRSEKEELKWLTYSIYENSIQRARATLVIVDTIKEVEDLKAELLRLQVEDKKIAYSELRIITYSIGGKKEAKIIEESLRSRDVVIATNLGGRGTDLKINSEVKKNGGLYVISTSFSESSRVDDQRKGRGGRKDEPGSYQRIANLEKINTNCNEKEKCLRMGCNDEELSKLEECIIKERDVNEQLRLIEDKLIRVPYLKIKDAIYSRFVELRRDFNSPTGYKLVINLLKKWDGLENYTLNLYRDGVRIKLKVVKKPTIVDIDITQLIKDISSQAEQKILAVLLKENSQLSSLSGLDYSVIHFIAASCGYYLKNPEIYSLMAYRFSDLLAGEGAKEKAASCGSGEDGYFRWLLKNDDKYEDLQSEELENLLCTDAKIDRALLDKVTFRHNFFLWMEQVELYKNGANDKQLVEDFGLWFKQYFNLPKYNLYSLFGRDGQEKAKQMIIQFATEMNNQFSVFDQEERTKYQNGSLVQNPAYPINEAWKLLWIYKDYRNIRQRIIEGISGVMSFFSQSIDKNNAEILSHLENLLHEAIRYCDKAIEFDPEFYGIWAAYNAKAVLEMVQKVDSFRGTRQKKEANEAIVNYIKYMQKAIGAIQTWVIARLEAQLSFFVQRGLRPADHYAKQLIFTISSYKRIVVTFEENIKVAVAAINEERGVLDVERPVTVEEVILGIDVDEAVKHYLSTKGITGKDAWLIDDTVLRDDKSGMGSTISHRQLVVEEIEQYGGYLFKMRVAKLKEEEKDWAGTVFSVVLGSLSIFAGIAFMAIPGAGVFLTSFASSLVMQGAQDIISAAVSVFTGHPISFKDYISMKGVSLAISAAISGALHFLQKLSDLYDVEWLNIGKKMEKLQGVAKNSPGTWVFDTFKLNVATRVISRVTSELGNKMLVDENDIAAEANSAIGEIIQSNRNLLGRLQATNMLNSLYRETEVIISGYKWRFSVGSEAAINAGTNIVDEYTGGYGQYINAATHVISSSMESANVLREIASKVKESILSKESHTLKTGEIFRQLLINSYQKVGDRLAYALNAEKLDINDKYECSALNDIELDKALIEKKIKGEVDLVGKCEETKKLLTSSDDFKSLRTIFVSGITSLKSDIQKSGTESVANLIGNKLAKPAVDLADGLSKGIIDYIKTNQAHSIKYPQTPAINRAFDRKIMSFPQSLVDESSKNNKKFLPQSEKPKDLEVPFYKPTTTETDEFNNRFDRIMKGDGKLISAPAYADDPELLDKYAGDSGSLLDKMWSKHLNDYLGDSRWDRGLDFNNICPMPKLDLGGWWYGEALRSKLQLPPAVDLKLYETWYGRYIKIGDLGSQAPETVSDDRRGTQGKPTIELVVRDAVPFLDKKHGFTIFTDSNGQKTIIAGYPEKHNFLYDLQVIDAPYIEANKELFGDDWAKGGKYEKNTDKYTIISSTTLDSDQELQSYISKAREAVRFVETGSYGGRFDYDICATDKCWGANSNTVQRLMYDNMEIKIEVPSDIDMPGIDGKFYVGPMDNLLSKMGEELPKMP